MLRRATAADIARLMAIRAAVRENRLADRRTVTQADYAARLGSIHVAETLDGIVGFGCGDPVTGNVWALFVDPAHEGCGHGRALLDAVVGDLAAGGCREAWLTTDPDTRAAGFYRRLGWTLTGTVGLGELRFANPLTSPRPAG